MLQAERRRKRSERAAEALSYQLSHVKHQEDLLAFVLADSDGLLMAAAPSTIEGEALAAICPLLERGEAGAPELSLLLGAHTSAKVSLLPLRAQDEEFFLFAVGATEEATTRATQQAEGGVQRIFTMFFC